MAKIPVLLFLRHTFLSRQLLGNYYRHQHIITLLPVDGTFVRLVAIVSQVGGQIPQKPPKKGRE